MAKTAFRRLGDLYLLDMHRVLVGDSTSPEAVAILNERISQAALTDPPYGVTYDPTWRERAGLGRAQQTGLVQNDDRVDWTEAYKLFPGDVAYLWHAGVHAAEVAANLEAVGFRIRAQIIWAKQHFALSRGDYHWQHEPCWYAVREENRLVGDRKQSTVRAPNLNPFGGSREEPKTDHGRPTQGGRSHAPPDPQQHSSEGHCYDPFLGSGTTLIAAHLTDRVCYGPEIDPHYCDVIVTRWQDLTGKKAILEADGRTFKQVAEDRKQIGEVEACPA